MDYINRRSQEKLALRMGERGNELLIEKYSFEKFISAHEKVYKKELQ